MDSIEQVYAPKQRVCDYRPENQSGGQWLSVGFRQHRYGDDADDVDR
jgi:hypothetical protein